jgi:hypothetical protein
MILGGKSGGELVSPIILLLESLLQIIRIAGNNAAATHISAAIYMKSCKHGPCSIHTHSPSEGRISRQRGRIASHLSAAKKAGVMSCTNKKCSLGGEKYRSWQ